MGERLTWKEIKQIYPDQWVGLINVEYEPDNHAKVKSAIVKYTDKTKNELLEMKIDTNGEIIGKYTTPENLLPFVGVTPL